MGYYFQTPPSYRGGSGNWQPAHGNPQPPSGQTLDWEHPSPHPGSQLGPGATIFFFDMNNQRLFFFLSMHLLYPRGVVVGVSSPRLNGQGWQERGAAGLFYFDVVCLRRGRRGWIRHHLNQQHGPNAQRLPSHTPT